MATFDTTLIREILGDVLRLPDEGPPRITHSSPGPEPGRRALPPAFEYFDAESPHATVRGRISTSQPIASVDSAIVAPPYAGQGKGMELYQMVLDMAKERGLYLTSDRMVSDDAKKVYQRLANQGETVYDGGDVRQVFDNDDRPGYTSEVYNKNSAGGPTFAVIPQGNPGNLRDLLARYTGATKPEVLDFMESTYTQLKAASGGKPASSPEELAQDADWQQVLSILGGVVGTGGAVALSEESSGIMDTIGL